jgi:DNA polymerase
VLFRSLFLDLETYCEVPIKNGTHAYAAHAEIMLLAWAIDNGPVSVWDLTTGYPMPKPLVDAVYSDDVLVCAHNSHFDRSVLRYRGFRIATPRWRDTMIKALAHSMPAGLGDLCDALSIPTDKTKDKDGRRLVLKFCKPNAKGGRNTRETHPGDWARFVEYARLDVEAMRACDQKLPDWNYRGAELDLWHLDQTINDRGVLIDMDLVNGAISAVEMEQKRLSKSALRLTGGAVQSATQRDAVLKHIAEEYGIEIADLQGATVEKLLAGGDLPAEVAELLTIRLQASTSSTAKYKTLAKAISADGRLRGTLQFNGASRTGRWAGRLFQPQNIPRGSIHDHRELERGIEALKIGIADLLYE